jgi:hypothetical protein
MRYSQLRVRLSSTIHTHQSIFFGSTSRPHLAKVDLEYGANSWAVVGCEPVAATEDLFYPHVDIKLSE